MSVDWSVERPKLVEGEDYYREGATLVFTARYHLRRGHCCGNGCRHCPYDGRGGGRDGEKEARECPKEY